MKKEIAIIIGAGPAGLTAAYELVQRTDIQPVIFEKTSDIGGISKTVNYKGNRIDIGGHRFFSKSDRVLDWWLNIMPEKGSLSGNDNTSKSDTVLLRRNRLSRIFFMRKFFNYPISIDLATIKSLGIGRTIRIGLSYIQARIRPIRNESSLEDFIVNRFGRELYNTFFKHYTEKIWGKPCDQISRDWGAQRIKGLSISKAVLHAIKQLGGKDRSIAQKKTETSLIESFLYPKYGPGQMWEEVAKIIQNSGGMLLLNHEVIGLELSDSRLMEVAVRNIETGEIAKYEPSYVLSTMPVKELIEDMNGHVPDEVKSVAGGLEYRDFISVGLLLNELKIKNKTNIKTLNNLIPDHWIYIQERDVKLGRFQIFNNWSPYMVHSPDKVWLGLEYFCNEGDELWSRTDDDFARFAIDELASIGIIDKDNVIDHVVIRMPKTYPAYFGTYDRFDEIREFADTIGNLFLIGRNGMHRYNNQDHSMLTAMEAVDNIIAGVSNKENIWSVNIEEEYHESK